MRKLSLIAVCFFLFLCSLTVKSQTVPSGLLHHEWNASWIEVPGEPATGYGVYLFRRVIDLPVLQETFIVHVSADNRYKLFVNGIQVSLGPARGDLDHWNFATLDLKPFLHSGKNVIAARVWNDGDLRPEGQISLRTGFILQGDGTNEEIINTGRDWKCTRDISYHPIKFSPPTYYVAGPGEQVNMNLHFTGWENINYPDSNWKNAQTIMRGLPTQLNGGYGTVSGWMLQPSVLPPMEMKKIRFGVVRNFTGIQLPSGFPQNKVSFTIPANTVVTILLDQGLLINAYPELIFSGGKDATIALGYAESLFTHYPSKGNRDEIAGKEFIGRKDSIISNGDREQLFSSLSFRTYRYVQIKITTQNDPLVIEDFDGVATGYPFQLNARLDSDIPEMKTMFETGWHTARLCAMETYMDCPYYEQLQYIGDSRIQAMISIYNSGDERLLKNAMNEMDNSRRPEGVTLSRHPSYTPQYIPTFSLWYIGMLHDYFYYGRDSNFVKEKMAGVRQILHYFNKYQQEDGSLKGVPFWMFTDWVEKKGWNSGVGPVGADGNSALLDLQLLWAYQLAADLEMHTGMSANAALYTRNAAQLKSVVLKKYWSDSRSLFADRSEKDFYSQHANALAILTGIVNKKQEAMMARKLVSDTSLAQASIYFKYYLHLALVKAGMGESYLEWLDIWRKNLASGLTTWAEISDINDARSDCHAWGASPNIEFFRTVIGIDSDAPGFRKIKVEPHPGKLKRLSGEMPHPSGKISADYKLENQFWDFKLNLPPGLNGKFIWKQKEYPLHTGGNKFRLKA